MKQAIKKKTFNRPGLDSIKESLGLKGGKDNMVTSSANKPIEFIPLPKAFEEATRLPGIPMGEPTIIFGHSNTGKSLIKNLLIASAQRKGILTVLFETENNFSFTFAKSCGVQAEPIYGDVEVEDIDEETGEITGTHMENRIVDYDAPNFLFYDTTILADRYGDIDHSQGKKVSKKRTIPVLEDIVYCMNEILDLQDEGKIQQPILFIWDSVGSITSYKSYASKTGNNMFDAAAINAAFSVVLGQRIASSKKVSNPYTNSFVAVNKVWVDSVTNPMAAPSIKLKGGNQLLYMARLTIQLGGVTGASTKRLSATSKGETYTYGLKTKIKIVKNQIDEPFNLTTEGEFCCVPDGMITEADLDNYKKERATKILEQLRSQIISKGKDASNIVESDIEYLEEDTED